MYFLNEGQNIAIIGEKRMWKKLLKLIYGLYDLDEGQIFGMTLKFWSEISFNSWNAFHEIFGTRFRFECLYYWQKMLGNTFQILS